MCGVRKDRQPLARPRKLQDGSLEQGSAMGAVTLFAPGNVECRGALC